MNTMMGRWRVSPAKSILETRHSAGRGLMDLLGTLRALTRCWWLTLLLLLLSFGGLAFFYTALPWTYQSSASVLFLSSPSQTKEAGGNPYQQFADSLHVS